MSKAIRTTPLFSQDEIDKYFASQSNRILIVDDEPGILQAYKDILTPATNVVQLKSSRNLKGPGTVTKTDGFELVLVSSGEEALEHVRKSIAERKPFAMGFFDVILKAGIDGIETVRQIHEIDSEMYAVLVTAYQDRHVSSIQEIFGAEFQDRWDYLNKPFSEGEILQKARAMVSMWNVRQQARVQAAHLDSLKRKMGENEKTLTVAAVARSVGHEFGNILLQILGRADLALKASPDEMKKALETIISASEQASKVLQRFKTLSNNKKQSEPLEKISLKKPIEDTISLMHHELHRRSIETELIGFDQIPMVNGNVSSLIQVFMNLVINACHAIKENGKIVFTAKKLSDNSVEIKVRDTGPGIPEQHLEDIFEAFFSTKGESGTGLGLCVCKEVIEINHRGKLSAANNGGAEFTIILPVEGDGEDL